MARKKTKTRSKKKPARSASRAKPKAAVKPARRRAASKSGAPGSDVERRWKEYWGARKKLEEAVEAVKSARAALQEAQDLERSCRSDFESVKSSLTTLLDVEPAGGPQKQPTPMPQRSGGAPQGLPAPQSVPGQKPAS